MNSDQKGSSSLTMICVSPKQEQHNRYWKPALENQKSPVKTSYSAIEARPLQSFPISTTNMDQNGGEFEQKKREKEQKRRSKNWTRIETMKLIGLRSELEPRFIRSGRKSELWNEISEALRSQGICRDLQQCRDKWEKLTAGYKEVRDGIREKEDYPYYEDLDPLLSSKINRKEYQNQSHRLEIQREIGEENALNRSDGEETEDATDFRDRKRRKSVEIGGNEMMDSLKDLLDSIMARQHRFFVDLLESMERRERIREKIRQEREDKWREEDRAQRLVFQNAMIVLTKKLVNDGVKSNLYFSSPGVDSSPAPEPASTIDAGGGGLKKRSKNWKRSEVLLLIKLRSEMEGRFVKSTRRAVLWDELAVLLCAEGVKRDGKQCREKWDKLMAEYKEVSEGKREPGENSPYFAELLALTRGSSPSVDADYSLHVN